MLEKRENSVQLTVSQVEKQLVNAYSKLIKNKIPFRTFPSVMLWGPPGVGKSQGVKSIAKKLELKTKKKVYVTDVRLLLFNPVDLRGIPTANEDKTLAVWLKPQIFQMDDSEDVVNILFLDEISAAPQSVQAAAYQITLDRTVGEHRLPDNCIVIAAGNRVTDRSVAYTMPKALANRLMHIEVVGDSSSWLNWAVQNNINHLVYGFIGYSPAMLMDFDSSSSGLAFPTPRSWEMVSNILNNISEDIPKVFPLIAGCIGMETAYSFRVWSEIYDAVPDVKTIFNGIALNVPEKPEIALALASKIAEYLKDHHSAMEVENAINYVFSMPIEYRNQALVGFLAVKEITSQLMANDRYCNWFLHSGRDWDDYR